MNTRRRLSMTRLVFHWSWLAGMTGGAGASVSPWCFGFVDPGAHPAFLKNISSEPICLTSLDMARPPSSVNVELETPWYEYRVSNVDVGRRSTVSQPRLHRRQRNAGRVLRWRLRPRSVEAAAPAERKQTHRSSSSARPPLRPSRLCASRGGWYGYNYWVDGRSATSAPTTPMCRLTWRSSARLARPRR